MRFLRLFLFAIIAANGAGAVAQNTRGAELAFADSELNEVYAKIMKRLSQDDATKLRQAQRYWIQFRDADCRLAFTGDVRDCLIDRTVARTTQLRETWYYDKSGSSFQLAS